MDLIPNPVICNYCRTALKSAYDFKSRCLLVEKKIREYIETQTESDEVNYDLSQISLRDLPALDKISFLQDLEIEETTSTAAVSESDNDSLLLKQLQKEINLPATGEIEVTPNISKRNGKYTAFRGRPPKSAHPQPESDGNFVCTRCYKTFPDTQTLALHRAVHGDDFVCNFCNEGFRSLQNLRRHNSNCPKGKSLCFISSSISIYTIQLLYVAYFILFVQVD